MSEEAKKAMLEEMREKERLAEQFIVYPYSEVKETLDKVVRETVRRSAIEYAEKYTKETAA